MQISAEFAPSCGPRRPASKIDHGPTARAVSARDGAPESPAGAATTSASESTLRRATWPPRWAHACDGRGSQAHPTGQAAEWLSDGKSIAEAASAGPRHRKRRPVALDGFRLPAADAKLRASRAPVENRRRTRFKHVRIPRIHSGASHRHSCGRVTTWPCAVVTRRGNWLSRNT